MGSLNRLDKLLYTALREHRIDNLLRARQSLLHFDLFYLPLKFEHDALGILVEHQTPLDLYFDMLR